MPETVNRQVVLASRPTGDRPRTTSPWSRRRSGPGPGQFLARTILPVARPLHAWPDERPPPTRARRRPLGQPMVGGTVGQVVRSNHPGFAEGDFVLGYWGWQEYGLSDGTGVRKLDPQMGPLYALGVLGMPGMTAYVALLDIGRPQPGETVVVSAAAGRRRLGRRSDRRVQGLPGRRHRRQRREVPLRRGAGPGRLRQLQDAGPRPGCRGRLPGGIDVYYDNVGGPVLEAVLRHINRVPASRWWA